MDDEPPLWRKILHGVQDDLLNSLGQFPLLGVNDTRRRTENVFNHVFDLMLTEPCFIQCRR